MIFKKYTPLIDDIVKVKHNDTIGRVKKIVSLFGYRDMVIEILYCHNKEREGEDYFVGIDMCKLIWRR